MLCPALPGSAQAPSCRVIGNDSQTRLVLEATGPDTNEIFSLLKECARALFSRWPPESKRQGANETAPSPELCLGARSFMPTVTSDPTPSLGNRYYYYVIPEIWGDLSKALRRPQGWGWDSAGPERLPETHEVPDTCWLN